MATFQLPGLPSQQIENQTAGGLGLPAVPQYAERPNTGLMLAQGLGNLIDTFQAADKQKSEADFMKSFGAAYAANDRDAMKQLVAAHPEQIERIQKGMGFIDQDRNQVIGQAAMDLRLAAKSGDQSLMSSLQKNAPILNQMGLSPEEAFLSYKQDPQQFDKMTDLIHFHADPNSYFDVRDKQEGRDIDRDKLAETERSNRSGEALTLRGQNISAQNSSLDREIRRTETQEKVLDRRLQREKNDLEREKLQQQIKDSREKLDAARNEKFNAVMGNVDDLGTALKVGNELNTLVNDNYTVVSRNQGGMLGKLPNLTDDTKTLTAKTDEYNLKVVLPALRGTFGGNPTEGERTALMQSKNNLKNATTQEDYLRELEKSQNVIIGMQKRQIKSLGIPVTKSNDEATDVQMLLSDPSLVSEYIKTYGYLPDEYYKQQLGGK